jgi:hypothetical protein
MSAQTGPVTLSPGSLTARAVAAGAAVVLCAGVAVAAVSGDGGTKTSAGVTGRPSASPTESPATSPSPKATRSPRAEPRPSPQATKSPAAARPLFPLPAEVAYPKHCPAPPRPPGPAFVPPKPEVKARSLPDAVKVPAHRKVDLAPVRGKGMWLTTWEDSRVDVPRVVAQAKAAGLTQLWVRTGGTYQGWYGAPLLTRLLPAAHAAGIQVVAWDYPTLGDPVADAARAAKVITGKFGGERIDAFSPDIEEIYEGTFDTPRRVRVYLSRVRATAGSLPVIATVLRPLDGDLSARPYRAMAPYVDVFAPMIYWSCNEPGVTALSALRPLAKLRPVHLIGQSYNMGPEGGRPGMPTAREIWRFLDVAKRGGAVGASLYVYDQTREPQWRALGHYPWR